MGLHTVNAVMCHAHGISDRDKLILIGLAMHANDETRIAWPSANRLTRYAGIAQIPNTRRNLKNLKNAGFIEEVERRERPTRSNHAPKAYRIIVDCNEHCHTEYCTGHYPEGAEGADYPPLYREQDGPKNETGVSPAIPLDDTGVSPAINRGIAPDTQLTVKPLSSVNELTHVNVADSQATQRQVRERTVENEAGFQEPSDAAEYLASPGDGKAWTKQLSLDGKIANASTRAAFDAWRFVFKAKPAGKFAQIPPMLGKNVRSAAKEIAEDDQDSAELIVKSAMRTVVLLEIYCKTYESQCGCKVPGEKAMSASGNILTALLEKHEWSDVQAAVKAAASEGSHKIGQKLTNAHFGGPESAATPSWANGITPAQPRTGVMSAISMAMAMDPKRHSSSASPAAPNGDVTAHQNERIASDDPR